MKARLGSPAALAVALRKLGVPPAALSNAEAGAHAALHSHGEHALAKAAARELRAADDATLAKVRALIGHGGAGHPVAGRGGAKLRSDVERSLSRCKSPEAEHAAEIYLADAKRIGRPMERFLVHTARLHDDLAGPKAKEMLADPKVGEGVRKHLFMLEALIRFYAPRGPEKKMERARVLIKELEDRVGWNGDAIAEAASAKAEHGVPQDVNGLLDKHARQAQDELVAVMEGAKGSEAHDAGGWRVDENGKIPALVELVDILGKIDFGTEREDNAFVKTRLASLCGEVKADGLDLHQLEDGVHKLRRNLRWIPITLIALDGKVTLDDKPGPIAALEKLRDDAVAKSPFARLPVTSFDKAHVAIPWTLFLGLSKHIADLGALKDRGMRIEVLARALEHQEKLDKKDARRKAESLVGDPGGLAQVEADAERLRAELDASGLLPALAHAFQG